LGAIRFSIDERLAQILKGCLGISTFVETGTFKGGSVRLMRDLFARIHTVERAPALAEKAREVFADAPHIEVVCGDSPGFLAALRPRLAAEPTLYWLDAHWCAADGVSPEQKCPLLDELASIGALNEFSVLLIDDARLFLSPPLPPHRPLDWPGLHQVLLALAELSASHRVMILNDTILFYPPAAAAAVEDYARHNGFDLLEVMNRLRHSSVPELHDQLVAKEAVIQDLVREVDRLRRAPRNRRINVVDRLRRILSNRREM
jgi:hypothetical protein